MTRRRMIDALANLVSWLLVLAILILTACTSVPDPAWDYCLRPANVQMSTICATRVAQMEGVPVTRH
jgi:hypothetical protein